jgi:hypothetical protein
MDMFLKRPIPLIRGIYEASEGMKMRNAISSQCYYDLQHSFKSRTVRIPEIKMCERMLEPVDIWISNIYGPVNEQPIKLLPMPLCLPTGAAL